MGKTFLKIEMMYLLSNPGFEEPILKDGDWLQLWEIAA